MREKRVTGNYEIRLMLTGESGAKESRVFFSGISFSTQDLRRSLGAGRRATGDIYCIATIW